MMEYRALRVLATVYKIMAWVILVVGSFVSLALLFSSSVISQGLGVPVSFGTGFLAALISISATLIQFVFFLGLGELISLVFEIEANTRPPQVETEERKMAA